MKLLALALAFSVAAGLRSEPPSSAIELWNRAAVAFGVFVPDAPAARRAAYDNPLYDFFFLNLEQRYDADRIRSVRDELTQSANAKRKTLIVRIPPLGRDGADATRSRVKDAFALGADGVAVPHVRGAEEARQVLEFFAASGANIWSAANRGGDKLAMLMIEDPAAVAQAKEIASLKGYSILACGIGSLTRALNGDRDAAEAGNRAILAETKRANLVNMLTMTSGDVERRVREGYLGLIALGSDADEAIVRGRKAARRQ